MKLKGAALSTNNSLSPLTNGSLTFAPDSTGLQTYSAATPGYWTPTPGGTIVELPQIGLWVGEPGLGPANAIGHIEGATQSVDPDGAVVSQFSADDCAWEVTSGINPQAAELTFRVERKALPDAEELTGAEAPEFGIFIANAGDELGSLTVTQPAGASRPGSNVYLIQHEDGDHAVDYTSTLTVSNGTAHDLGLNEVAIYANGPVLEVTIEFAAS